MQAGRTAVELNPNIAQIRLGFAQALIFSGRPEEALEPDLARRGGEQVRPPGHLGHPGGGVVHHHRELVREEAIRPLDHEIARSSDYFRRMLKVTILWLAMPMPAACACVNCDNNSNNATPLRRIIV